MPNLMLEISLPEEIFDMLSIQVKPNTKSGNIYYYLDATESAGTAFCTGGLVSEILNIETKKHINDEPENTNG